LKLSYSLSAFRPKKIKSAEKIRIIPDDFLVDFIKSTHVSTLIMEFHEVSLRVIFGELAE
jgi:hypothetical protein